MMQSDWSRQRVTVMGLGSFGGGIGAVRYFANRGARVTVTDLKTEAQLADSVAQLDGVTVADWHLGSHPESAFTDADLVVVSPAVPRDHTCLQMARSAGVPITSEMNLFWERNRGRVIAVTGSAGKSTTTAWIHALLTNGLPRTTTWLGGNIGVSLLPDVERIAAEDWVVLELSSFQLEDLAPLRPSPHIAVVTSFAPNHLDRHGTLESYRRAKQNLLRFQTTDDYAVLPADDADVRTWPGAANRLWFGGECATRGSDSCTSGVWLDDGVRRCARVSWSGAEWSLPVGEWVRLPGPHNLRNAAAAVCAALAAGVPRERLEPGLRTFGGLSHRLQRVAERAGRTFYNDSKSTTPEATALAIRSFTQPIVLLAGGSDKKVDLQPIITAIARSRRPADSPTDQRPTQGVVAVAFLGQTGPQLAHLLEREATTRTIPHAIFGDFPAACAWSASQSRPGDVILLSPGCASYDWFRNYEHRGDMFAEIAQKTVWE